MISSLLLVLCCLPLSAEEVTDTLVVFFRQNSSELDLSYMENARRVDALKANVANLQKYPDFKITGFECHASASPEGSVIYNEYISRARLRTAHAFLYQTFGLPDSLQTNSGVSEGWDVLTDKITADERVPDRDILLKIISNANGDEEKERQIKLLNINAWNYISWKYFRYMRSIKVYVNMTYTLPDTVSSVTDKVVPEVVMPDTVTCQSVPVVQEYQAPERPKSFTLKTNLIGWAAMGANLAVEVDLAPHLSISLPIHYSGGVEYMETLKFRCIVFQPELRYYPWLNKGRNQGFFLGLHGGAGHYNFAFDGDFRYQDKDGRRPAYGGGLGMGCSFRFGKNTGWGMEIAVSGGVYDAEYDIFYNEPNGPYYKKGVRSLWYGVDNASLSLFYKFDIKKKRGVK